MEIIDVPYRNEHFDIKIHDEHYKIRYGFSSNVERIDKMIEWLFENTKDRFVLLGTDRIYFESSADAMAFKLVWL